MPRKVNYGAHFYDGDDGYDDYEEYDDEYEVTEKDEAPASKPEIKSSSLWRCSICTYDNDESAFVCDICGVLRNPSASNYSNFDKSKAPFKFDVPSPDDLVSNGLRSAKVGSKADFLGNKSSKVSSGVTEKNIILNGKSTLKSSDSSALLVSEGKKGNKTETDYSVGMVVPKKSNSKNLESIPKGKRQIQQRDKVSDNSTFSVSKGKNRIVDDASSTSITESKHDNVSSDMHSMSLSDKAENSHNVNAQRAKSQFHYQPDKWMIPDKAEDALIQLNLAIVGHVDSGKSTLSGRLLHLLGRVTQKEMHKYEKEAKLLGKGSFAYAWALDVSHEERERGITMTVAVAYFDSKNYHVVVLDSPGHKDFVPNMISGATQADAAILVIDASAGAFEAGMDSTRGQTREHAQLIRSFGVDQIIVVVNKMDVVDYSKDRFDLIKSQLGTFLRTCGFKDSLVSWVPLSAMENQNLVASPSDVRLSSWFSGPHLLDAIDSLQSPTRDFSKPLLMPICDIIRSSAGQVAAHGKLEAGALRIGLKVSVMPSGEIGTVRALERNSQTCTVARAGDNVAVSLAGIDASYVRAGGVICHPDFPVDVAQHLELKVLIFDFATPILIGSRLEFHIHHAKESARVVRITSLLDPKTGKVTKKSPRCLTSKQSAVLEVVLDEPVCVEEFSNSRALGRVFMRALGRTIAVGIVTRIIRAQE